MGELFECGGLNREAAQAYQEALRPWDGAAEEHPARPVARLRLSGLVGVNLTEAAELAGAGKFVLPEGWRP